MRISFHASRTAALAALWLCAATALAQTTSLEGVVNVNLATAEELALLPGVGPARAEAIIAYRKQHGPFKRVADLVEVSGIGEKALTRIRPHCVLEGKTTAKVRQDS